MTTQFRLAAVGSALMALTASPKAGLAQPDVAPNARVRVSAPPLGIEAWPGVLTRATADSLSIDFRNEGRPMTIPIDAVSRLEVSVGKDRLAGFASGAIWGVIAGAVLGVVLVGATDGCDEFCPLAFFLIGAGGAGVGLIIGGIIGASSAPERWRDVPLRRGSSGPPSSASRVGAHIGFAIPF